MTLQPKNFKSGEIRGNVKMENQRKLKSEGKMTYWVIESYAKFNSSQINWWWPNGHGKPALYNATITWVDPSGEKHQIFRTFGFRTVELVQNRVSQAFSEESRRSVHNANQVGIYKGANPCNFQGKFSNKSTPIRPLTLKFIERHLILDRNINFENGEGEVFIRPYTPGMTVYICIPM